MPLGARPSAVLLGGAVVPRLAMVLGVGQQGVGQQVPASARQAARHAVIAPGIAPTPGRACRTTRHGSASRGSARE